MFLFLDQVMDAYGFTIIVILKPLKMATAPFLSVLAFLQCEIVALPLVELKTHNFLWVTNVII